jgi:hypothetical protein
MEAISERKIMTVGLGCFMVCVALVWLLTLRTSTPEAPTGYIAGVWSRSLSQPFQALLLGAVLAVPLHAAWVAVQYGGVARKPYEAFAQWGQTLFTSFGFMGTIMGVSLAVAGLQDAMLEGDPGGLISGLSTAFDTTFLGLVGAVSLMVLRRLARISDPATK